MARKVIVSLVDDFDGTSEADETVTFGIDGVTYEIDLSPVDATSRFRDAAADTLSTSTPAMASCARTTASSVCASGQHPLITLGAYVL
ncbi:histone-like nucleoid-structuring protein Lsr2 [Nocardia salmonicida]|uniref:Lsr2 dimerization domain-containing protein n=1 Tax=Nocardia salmonicida TaxID=53431 RepID=UPI00366EA719